MAAPYLHLVFVCTGNTCRSPMAESLLRSLLPENTAWEVHSAGVAAANGAPASEFAVRAMKEKGLDLREHEAHQVDPKMLRHAHKVITMTQSHLDYLQMQFELPQDKGRTLGSYRDQPGDIMDPFGGSLDTYRLTRDEIEQILLELVLELQETV